MVRWMLVGFAIWAMATYTVRLTDIFALPPGLSERLLLLAAIAVPLLFGALWLLVRNVPPENRLPVAAAIAAPGMVADAIATIFYAEFFPLADPASASAFGALMLWGYAVIILSGAILGADRAGQ
jgi:hypothetical protein